MAMFFDMRTTDAYIAITLWTHGEHLQSTEFAGMAYTSGVFYTLAPRFLVLRLGLTSSVKDLDEEKLSQTCNW
jgi:hypothetical protein